MSRLRTFIATYYGHGCALVVLAGWAYFIAGMGK